MEHKVTRKVVGRGGVGGGGIQVVGRGNGNFLYNI